jgi:hypothetical protein
MKYPGFIGPAYQLDAYSADSQEAINLYPEKDESGTGKSEWILRGTPGIDWWQDVADFTHTGGIIRAIFQTDTHVLVIAGGGLYKIMPNKAVTYIDAVANDAGNSPAFIHANGNEQFLIVSANHMYTLGGSTLTPITFGSISSTVNTTDLGISARVDRTAGDSFVTSWAGSDVVIDGSKYRVFSVESGDRMYCSGPLLNLTGKTLEFDIPTEALTSTYMDGYGIINPPDSNEIYISGVHNFASDAWELASQRKEGYADHIARVFAHKNLLWLLGYETTEVWQNTGAADFPFERVPGGFLQIGTAARWAVCGVNAGVVTIARDSRGVIGAYLFSGLNPQRISTHAIEQTWAGYSDITDATAYTYAEGGHEFWVITFGSANATWVWDATTGLWHRRAYGTDRQLQATHTYWVSQKVRLVGSRSDNKIYTMSDSHLDDDGTAIVRTRSAPHIAEENKQVFHHRLQLDMQMGTKSGGGSGSVTMSYSNDGGRTWSTDRTASTGAASAWTTRAFWHRLGRSRDRVYRVKISDAQKVTLIGAYLETS